MGGAFFSARTEIFGFILLPLSVKNSGKENHALWAVRRKGSAGMAAMDGKAHGHLFLERGKAMLVELAGAPAAAGLFFMYIKDKYEKEPWKMLLLGLLYGVYTAAVIYALGRWLEWRFPHEETPLYTAFVSSAGVEEGVKFLFLFFLIWFNRNFNEPLDGIVYAVFLSLGFAWVENIIYVTHPVLGGYETALARAALSVPGHGLFGIQMGYHMGRARFCREGRAGQLFLAFAAPYLLHGLYNDFLLEKNKAYWVLFAGLEVLLWLLGLKRIREMQKRSPFRKKAAL